MKDVIRLQKQAIGELNKRVARRSYPD